MKTVVPNVRAAIVINTKDDPYFFDEFGFMHMPNTVLSHQGIFDYIQDDGTTVSALMPVEELQQMAENSKGSTITLEHPQDESGNMVLLNPENYKQFAKGYLSSVLKVEDGNLLGDLVIADKETQEAILNKTKKGISLGYRSHHIPIRGVDETGKPFDIVKKGLRLNQISVVENPRASNALFSLDSTEHTLDSTFKSLLPSTISLDSSDFKPIINEIKTNNNMPTEDKNNKETVDQLLEMQSKMIALQTNFDSLKATLDSTVKEKEVLSAELVAVKSASEGVTAAFDSYKAAQPDEAAIDAIVEGRVKAWAKAGDKIAFDSKLTELDIRRSSLAIDHPEHAETFKTASVEYLNAFEAAFDSLQAAAPKAPKPTFDSASVAPKAGAPRSNAAAKTSNSFTANEDGTYSLFDMRAKGSRR